MAMATKDPLVLANQAQAQDQAASPWLLPNRMDGVMVASCARCKKLGLGRTTAEAARAQGLQRCSRCQSVYYCNGRCQREDWARHKDFCRSPMKWVKCVSSGKEEQLAYHQSIAIRDSLVVVGVELTNELRVDAFRPAHGKWDELFSSTRIGPGVSAGSGSGPRYTGSGPGSGPGAVLQRDYSIPYSQSDFVAAEFACCGVADRFVFLFGGVELSQQTEPMAFFDDACLFDTETRCWIRAPPSLSTPSPRAQCTCTCVGDKVYVIGGRNAHQYFNDVYVFDAITLRWTGPLGAKGTIPNGLGGHSARLRGRSIVIFGGRSDGGQVSSVTRTFNVDSHEWSVMDTNDTVPRARCHHGGDIVGNIMLIFGGETCEENDRTAALGDLSVLWLDEGLWMSPHCLGSDRPHARVECTATVVGDHLYVYGGYQLAKDGSIHNAHGLCALNIEAYAAPASTSTPSSAGADAGEKRRDGEKEKEAVNADYACGNASAMAALAKRIGTGVLPSLSSMRLHSLSSLGLGHDRGPGHSRSHSHSHPYATSLGGSVSMSPFGPVRAGPASAGAGAGGWGLNFSRMSAKQKSSWDEALARTISLRLPLPDSGSGDSPSVSASVLQAHAQAQAQAWGMGVGMGMTPPLEDLAIDLDEFSQEVEKGRDRDQQRVNGHGSDSSGSGNGSVAESSDTQGSGAGTQKEKAGKDKGKDKDKDKSTKRSERASASESASESESASVSFPFPMPPTRRRYSSGFGAGSGLGGEASTAGSGSGLSSSASAIVNASDYASNGADIDAQIASSMRRVTTFFEKAVVRLPSRTVRVRTTRLLGRDSNGEGSQSPPPRPRTQTRRDRDGVEAEIEIEIADDDTASSPPSSSSSSSSPSSSAYGNNGVSDSDAPAGFASASEWKDIDNGGNVTADSDGDGDEDGDGDGDSVPVPSLVSTRNAKSEAKRLLRDLLLAVNESRSVRLRQAAELARMAAAAGEEVHRRECLIEELKAQQEESEWHRQSLGKSNKQWAEKLASLDAELRSSLEEETVALADAKKSLDQERTAREALQKRLDKGQKTHAKMQERYQAEQRRAESMRTALQTAKAEAQARADALAKAKIDLDKARAGAAAADARRDEAARTARATADELRGVQAKLAAATREAEAEAADRVKAGRAWEREREALESEKTSLRAQVEDHKTELEGVAERLALLDDEASLLRGDKQRLEAEVSALKLETEQLQRSVEVASQATIAIPASPQTSAQSLSLSDSVGAGPWSSFGFGGLFSSNWGGGGPGDAVEWHGQGQGQGQAHSQTGQGQGPASLFAAPQPQPWTSSASASASVSVPQHQPQHQPQPLLESLSIEQLEGLERDHESQLAAVRHVKAAKEASFREALARVQSDYDRMCRARLCVGCGKDEASIMLVPCRHVVQCPDCDSATRTPVCPRCSAPVERREAVFWQ